jgi:hypothetical protein
MATLVVQKKAGQVIGTKDPFDPILKYYQTFPQELTGEGRPFSVSAPPRSGRFTTFSELVGVLKTLAGGGEKEFVVCCHGQYTSEDTPVGLFMKAVAHSPFPADGDLFAKLEEIMDGQTQVEDVQQHFTVFVPTKKGNEQVYMPVTALQALVTDLAALRKLKLKRVDFRSCNLGKDPKLLGTLGRILGTQFITAPDVHMFYGGITPRRVLSSEMEVYNAMAPVRSNARTFSNPDSKSSGQRLDIAVIKVDEETYNTQMETNASSLEWFIDGWVMKVGSRYPRGSRSPVAFPLAGMIHENDSNAPYVCPLESDYAGHIKTVRMPVLVEITHV